MINSGLQFLSPSLCLCCKSLYLKAGLFTFFRDGGWKSLPILCVRICIGKTNPLLFDMTRSFHLVLVSLLAQSLTESRNLNCVLFACDRMRAIIKDRRLLSVCLTENIVTSCCCCDFAVNQPFFEALLPAMKKIHPHTVEPITSFVQAK